MTIHNTKKEILDLLDILPGRSADSHELAFHLAKRWEDVWQDLQELKAGGRVTMMDGRWILGSRERAVRAIVALATVAAAAESPNRSHWRRSRRSPAELGRPAGEHCVDVKPTVAARRVTDETEKVAQGPGERE